MKSFLPSLIAAAAALVAGAAQANVYITEWMYQGGSGEFVEFTNLGASPVDFAGWSYDDEKARPGLFLLSPFGMVQPGESVIITEQTDVDLFRLDWSLPDSVKVIGGIGSAFGVTNNNLGRSDSILLFNASGNVVDRLTYGDNTVGGPRTQGASGQPRSAAALGANDATQWVLSSIGDSFGSYQSLSGAIGTPGFTVYAPIPQPQTYALLLAGLAVVGCAARGRRAR
jgi:hypothetical protein